MMKNIIKRTEVQSQIDFAYFIIINKICVAHNIKTKSLYNMYLLWSIRVNQMYLSKFLIMSRWERDR